MISDCLAAIRDLPPAARFRAEAFLDEGHYYGWRLQAVTTKRAGNMLQCRLDFDTTTIIFLAQHAAWSKPTLYAPAAHLN